MNKIALICNRNYSVKRFRKNLIEDLKKEGYQVSLVIIDDSDEKIIIDDVDIHYIQDNNRSINPLKKIKLQKEIENVLSIIKPNKVFTFQVTPNTFGILAAHNNKIDDIYSMVEGAGDVFIFNTLKWKLIRFFTCILYRNAFKYVKKVFFLNDDDKDEFIERRLVQKNQCIVVPGIGVDTDYFAYKPITNTNTFLMIARMMPAKGVIEYCKVARIVKKVHPETVFNYIGEEFTLTKKDIQEYIDDGSINYLGYQEDVRPFIENCFVYVHPSYYREGFPMVIMEACSVGRATIGLHNVGAKEIIKDGYNGFLVEKYNLNDLANRIIYAIEHKKEMIEMGKNARTLAKNKFNSVLINERIIKHVS